MNIQLCQTLNKNYYIQYVKLEKNKDFDWIIFNAGFNANLKDWNEQLLDQLNKKYNLFLYNYRGIYPYSPYPNIYKPITKLNLNFFILYNDLLYIIDKLLYNKKVYLLGWSFGAIFVYYCLVQSSNPENLFKGAIIFAGRDYYNKYYPTVGHEKLVKSRFQTSNNFYNQLLQVLFPRNYLEYLGKKGYKLVKKKIKKNNYSLNKIVINAENSAIELINNNTIKIRSLWKNISKNSKFNICIFHASQDAIISSQYQEDMKIVLPQQWNIKYITYNGIDMVNGGHAFFMEEDIIIDNITVLKGLTKNITENIINFFN